MVARHRNIYQLFGDRSVFENDEVSLIIGMFQKQDDIENIIEDYNIVESKVNGLNVIGMTIASDRVLNGLSLSLSCSGWNAIEYKLQMKELNLDAEEVELEAKCRNVSTSKEINALDNLLPVVQVPVPKTGKLLYIKLHSLFPNLIFSVGASGFIQQCQSAMAISQIYDKLKDLNRVAVDLNGRNFEPSMFSTKASPESDTRDKLSELDVLFEDNIIRHCSWHLRYTPGAGRIHFCADAGDGNTIYVGYIGPKIGE